MNDLLKKFYSEHHIKGKRLRQSFMEKERSLIFSNWLGQGKKIIDLGCRDGNLTRHFTEGNQVIGGDIDSAALEYASKHYGFKTLQVDLNTVLPIEDDSFDAVIMAEILEHLPYPDITLQEVSRILKPKGKFIGNVPLAYHLKDRYQVLRGKKLFVGSDPTHLKYFSYDDLLSLLAKYFTVEEIKVLKGRKWAGLPLPVKLFARNVAFRCSN